MWHFVGNKMEAVKHFWKNKAYIFVAWVYQMILLGKNPTCVSNTGWLWEKFYGGGEEIFC